MENKSKQTAVEFAVAKLEKFIPKGNQIAIDAILEQAKEMEKEQIMMAVKNSWYMAKGSNFQEPQEEQYYNTEYGKDTTDNTNI